MGILASNQNCIVGFTKLRKMGYGKGFHPKFRILLQMNQRRKNESISSNMVKKIKEDCQCVKK